MPCSLSLHYYFSEGNDAFGGDKTTMKNILGGKGSVEAHVPGRRTRAACAGRMTQDERLLSQFD